MVCYESILKCSMISCVFCPQFLLAFLFVLGFLCASRWLLLIIFLLLFFCLRHDFPKILLSYLCLSFISSVCVCVCLFVKARSGGRRRWRALFDNRRQIYVVHTTMPENGTGIHVWDQWVFLKNLNMGYHTVVTIH